MPPHSPQPWWQSSTAYQIYPWSFQSTASPPHTPAVGTLNGIHSRLDHLQALGIDLIWLSPIYDSPQADMGYDVRDYTRPWAGFGTLADAEALIAAIRSRGMRVILDLVVNHTSHEHPWFRRSRDEGSRGECADWYLWRDGKDVGEGRKAAPNNWKAAFGGSAWTWAEERRQFYLHLCLEQQPDLNWEHPAVRAAVYEDAVAFWLRRGVSGFRVDSVVAWWKDGRFPDSAVVWPGEELQPMEGRFIMNGPPVHDWLRELRGWIARDFPGEEVLLVGELPGTETGEIMKYLRAGELDMVLDFDHFMAGADWHAPLHERTRPALPLVKDAMVKTQGLLEQGCWNSVFLESHDSPRSVSRFGPGEGEFWAAGAKMLALFMCTLSGTLFVYQGQEIGMANMSSSWMRDDIRDAAGLEELAEVEKKFPGDEEMKEKAMEGLRRYGRDNGRTPMQWSDVPYAGFSESTPWIRVMENYATVNVAKQEADVESVLSFWKRMIRLRKEFSAQLVHGRFEVVDRDNPQTFCYIKRVEGEQCGLWVMLNFSDTDVSMTVPECVDSQGFQLLMSSASGPASARSEPWKLSAWEGRIYIYGVW
jgi:alpha-glucosidase